MIITALLFVTIAIGSAVIGMYASPDQGLNLILYWLAVVCIGVAGGLTVVSFGMRRYRA